MSQPTSHTFDYDLIVIGSGAGGSAAATIAAREGKRVALIEADTFGGESPNWSDVPTKALLHAAHVYDEARHGSKFGLRTNTLGYNYPAIRAWKDLAVSRTGAGGNRRFYEQHGVSVFHSPAHFLSPHEITVGKRHLSAKHFLIATGADWAVPRIQGLRDSGYFTPRTILETLRPPKSLLIIGGGTASVEIAQLLATFGTKVIIVEKAARILPGFDPEVSETLATLLTRSKGVEILTDSHVVSVQKEGFGKRVTIERGGIERSLKADEILLAAGRAPRLDLGLENAAVRYTERGIIVDDHLKTTARHIFAAGAVIGRGGSTAEAILESRVAAHNILHPNKATPDYAGIAHLVFSTPEVAHVGLTEADARREHVSIKKALAPLSIIARSNVADFRDGFVKIVADQKGVVRGATIVAPHAGELIQELALAVRLGLHVDQIADTPHAFLSWSEAIRVAASKLS